MSRNSVISSRKSKGRNSISERTSQILMVNEQKITTAVEELKAQLKSDVSFLQIPFQISGRELYEMLNLISLRTKKKPDDVLFLAHYLTTFPTLFKILFKKQMSVKPIELLKKIANGLELEHIKKNHIICRFGQEGDKFYLIFKGKIAVLIKKEVKIKMTRFEYLSHILYLKRINETELLGLLSETDNFNLTKVDIQYYLNNESEIENPNKEPKIDRTEEINLNVSDNLNTEDYIYTTSPRINSTVPESLREIVTMYTYIQICTLEEGQTFGDVALGGDFKRTATIITNGNCMFGTLTKNIYDKCIKDIQERIRRNTMDLVINSELFRGINPDLFFHKYFSNFKLVKLNQGTQLFTQGEKMKEIFFLKEGEVEISFKGKYSDLANAITNCGIAISKKEELKNSLEGGELYKIALKNKENFFKVIKVKKGDIIGCDEYMNNGFYFCNAICANNACEAFSIEMPLLNELMNREGRIRRNYKEYVVKRKQFLGDRLMNLRKIFISQQMFIAKQKDDFINNGGVEDNLKRSSNFCNFRTRRSPFHFNSPNTSVYSQSRDKKKIVFSPITLKSSQYNSSNVSRILLSDSKTKSANNRPVFLSPNLKSQKTRTKFGSYNFCSGGLENTGTGSFEERFRLPHPDEMRRNNKKLLKTSINFNSMNSSGSLNNLLNSINTNTNTNFTIAKNARTKRIILPITKLTNKKKKLQEIKVLVLSNTSKAIDKTEKKFSDRVFNKISSQETPRNSSQRLVNISKNNTLVVSTIDLGVADKVAQTVEKTVSKKPIPKGLNKLTQSDY